MVFLKSKILLILLSGLGIPLNSCSFDDNDKVKLSKRMEKFNNDIRILRHARLLGNSGFYMFSASNIYNDTIPYDSLYKIKIYMDSDLILKLAKENGIKNYLEVNYRFISLGDSVMHTATVKNDTAYIDFSIEKNKLEKGITIVKWINSTKIDFNPLHPGVDTVFTRIENFCIKK